jgi:DNA-directed RNA polymerase subunit RPC12/RpoP
VEVIGDDFFAGFCRDASLNWLHHQTLRLMEIIFNCPNCEQELSVDGDGAGSEIKCPTCGTKITIPDKPSEAPSAPSSDTGLLTHNPIASSAAAKVEMHLKVPVRDKPAESLLKKPKLPLEAVAKGLDKKIRARTIRHAQCVEAGHDKFDQRITEVLGEVGEANIVGIHVFNYDHLDVGTQKVLMDFGVMVVYRV